MIENERARRQDTGLPSRHSPLRHSLNPDSRLLIPGLRRLLFPALVAMLSVVGLLSMLNRQAPAAAQTVLSVRGSSTAAYPGQETTLWLELLNHTDQIVYNGILTATLPPGFSYVPGSAVIQGEGAPIAGGEPVMSGQTLTWGPYHLPAAGTKIHNPFGVHTLMDSCDGIPALHLEGAKTLVGNGGYITQLFYPVDTTTTGPSQCAINFVNEAYARNLIPILRLEGRRVNGVWQAPDPGPDGDYSEIAQAYAAFVSGLPRRDTNPLYIAVWNEPDLWIEWSSRPNATEYARFFVAVSNAIRNLGDRRIRVVNGALTPGNLGFLEQMLRVPGFRDAFDVWASHCYPYNHPADYTIHSGTARYGTYAIDCYLDELAIIERYGRSNIGVMLTETGYRLGDNTFGFEGFSGINESNRAGYIASAFRDYWQNWPEIVAVTPFELSDPAKFWVVFDWIEPTSPYTPHLQYSAVAALPKPGAGQLEPYGYQVIFRARVSTGTVTGTHFIAAGGSEQSGSQVFDPQAISVTVRSPANLLPIYLPLIFKSPGAGDGGAWYATAAVSPSCCAIVPGAFLTAGVSVQSPAAPQVDILPLDAAPLALAVDSSTGQAGVLLESGQLAIVNLAQLTTARQIFTGAEPQSVTAGPPGVLFAAAGNRILQIDLNSGGVVHQIETGGRVRGLRWDAAAQRLFAADAETPAIRVFTADLGAQVAQIPLVEAPDRLALDPETRRLFVSQPAAGQVLAVDTEQLLVAQTTRISGGPLLDVALEPRRGKLYALNVLSPGQRGIATLNAATLAQESLAGGTESVPLRTTAAIAAAPDGTLLLAGAGQIRRLAPDAFTINRTLHLPVIVPTGGLAAQENGQILVLDIQQPALVRVHP